MPSLARRLSVLAVATATAMTSFVAASAQEEDLPTLSVSDATASEGDGAITFTVSVDRLASTNVTASLRLNPQTAERGKDFRGWWVRAVIPYGETSTEVTVPLRDDRVDEPDETFAARITNSYGATVGDRVGIATITDDALTVNLVHINDHHSHLAADSGSADLGTSGGEFDYELGGFPRVVSKIDELAATQDNVVKIHAGDAISGTLYYTLFKGEADAALMNEACFDVFELGNHEFDDSDDSLARFLDWLNADPDCDTVTLGANVVPEVGTPLAPNAVDDYLQPYWVRDFDGEEVGFIGLDIAQKTRVSSSPLPTTQFLDEVDTAQYYVDELAGMGVDNVVLVTHYTTDSDLALVGQVTGVDAVVGGDSHTLLGDFGAFDLNSSGDYPLVVDNADGDPVCVVQAWQYSAVVGNLSLDLDQGRTQSCGGDPQLLVDGFTRDDQPIVGDELAEIETAIAAIPTVSVVEPDAEAQAILDTYSEQVNVLEQEVIGAATEDLCLNRIPGDDRSVFCAPDEVADSGARADVNGGFITQIVTDAYNARAFRADIALQNAGGVRIDIPEGDITIADAYELLPFANTLVEIELSGQEIATVLEEAVTNFLDNGGSTGSYPYGSGVRWDLDLTQPAGSRFSNIEVRADDGTWSAIDLGGTYIVATNSFLATGSDGWITFGEASADGRTTDTLIDYAQGFIDWLVEDAGGVVSVPAPEGFSTQSFVPAP